MYEVERMMRQQDVKGIGLLRFKKNDQNYFCFCPMSKHIGSDRNSWCNNIWISTGAEPLEKIIFLLGTYFLKGNTLF